MNKRVLIIILHGAWRASKPFISAVLLSVLFCAPVLARDWQLILIPQPYSQDQVLVNDASAQTLDKVYTHLEEGLSLSLTRSTETLIEQHKVFSSCQQYFCGQPNVSQLMQAIQQRAPNVHLSILYAFSGGSQPSLHVRLLDPISSQLRFTDSLALIGEPTPQRLKSLGQDMGALIVATLAKSQPQKQFTLRFDEFLFAELNGLTTAVLANNQNTQLMLRASSVSHTLWGQYLPLTSSEYTLETSLSASQVKQMLTRFFASQHIVSAIDFTQQNNADMTFSVTRQGNPYAPSLITRALILLFAVGTLGFFLRRRFLNKQLVEYAKKRNADMWLRTHKKAAFHGYMLRAKWASQFSYWSRLQKESGELSSQAKLYFDAGDVNTSKLFITKALYANAANAQANKLVNAIKSLEESAQSFSDSEQYIRNKLAKAMNNYSSQQPVKALHQLYQALHAAQNEDALKKQIKAIKKLIKRINKEFAQEISAVVISSSKDPTSIVLCQHETVHIGRRSNTDSQTWISKQDAVYFINHRWVSRAGQHGFIHRQNSGFYFTDSHSKNGSFINEKLTKAHQPERLHHGDIIQLGSKDSVAGVQCELQLSSSILQLALYEPPLSLVDRQQRNSLWPDLELASKTALVMLQHKCWLVYNASSHKISICEVGQLPSTLTSGSNELRHAHEPLNDQWEVLCLLSLGPAATIAPVHLHSKASSVLLEQLPLLGEVGLILPCCLSYNGLECQLNTYDSSSIRYTHGPDVKRGPTVSNTSTASQAPDEPASNAFIARQQKARQQKARQQKARQQKARQQSMGKK